MTAPSYAILFPGQGSQAVGMLGAHDAPVVARTFAEAGAALGWDLAQLVRGGPEEELNQTARTQPALLAAGVALWRLWDESGLPRPAALAGHSLGEYTALVAAGALDFADALRLVELRGQLMQAAVPAGTGGMAAVIGLDDAKVADLCKAYPGSEVLEPVNYNAPGQVVVAGQAAALDWLAANGKAHGARMVMRLPVSVPSHCSLMRDAAQKLADKLAATSIHAPAIPVYHNLDAAPHSEPASIRRALTEQLYRPVLWTSTIQKLVASGIGTFVECGPGKVLTGLTKRIADKSARYVSLEDPAGLQQALAWLKTA
ncbi:MAG TPA: ACP S-malonyltransferase [Nevskiaceae bacterium]|nr:ACP S-malonyltransferase [Nevskiaceae bacterium]